MKEIVVSLLSLIILSCQQKKVDDPVLKALKNNRPTLAEFGAGNCVACVKMKPIIAELQSEYQGQANILLIDVNEHRDLTPKYKVMLIPTQVFFNTAGKEIYRHVGFFPKDSILIFLKKAGLK